MVVWARVSMVYQGWGEVWERCGQGSVWCIKDGVECGNGVGGKGGVYPLHILSRYTVSRYDRLLLPPLLPRTHTP